MCDEHTRKFQCEYYTVYARPNSCFFCDNCNDIFYDYESGYASPYMWLCDKGNDTEVGMMGKCQDFYEEAEQTEPQIDDFFRELTAEERKAVAEYIESISVPTGVNIFDLMDEQTEREGE